MHHIYQRQLSLALARFPFSVMGVKFIPQNGKGGGVGMGMVIHLKIVRKINVNYLSDWV